MDISNLQFFVAIAVAPIGTVIYAVVASMANNRRAEEIKAGISERFGLLDRGLASMRADLATVSATLNSMRSDLKDDIALVATRTDSAVSNIKTELKNDIALLTTRTDNASRDLRTELRSDLKEFRSEIRADLKDALAQIRSDLAERRGQAGAS